MANLTARTLSPDDEARAIATLSLAFAADPMTRWTWPAAHDYVTIFPQFARAFGGRGFASRGAHGTGNLAAVALWLPPGVHPDDETLDALMQRTVGPERLAELGPIFEQMSSYHPSGPHWYLPLIGCDPAHQGNGHGATLMSYALAECDRQNLPAYLESTNPRNITLYLRHGFEALGTIQAGSSPPMVPMLRQPRTTRAE
jgi:GNAT superfamily N-acetyltransferase